MICKIRAAACLVNVVYDAFEHWKKLVKLCCFCEDSLSTRPEYFLNFISKFFLPVNPAAYQVSMVCCCCCFPPSSDATFSAERNPRGLFRGHRLKE